MNITSIIIYSRGKNCDEFGNPYHAFKAVIRYSYVSYFSTITICRNEAYGSSGERDCLMWAVQGINEALGLDIKMNDSRIEHHHKTVYHYSDLQNPENWRV